MGALPADAVARAEQDQGPAVEAVQAGVVGYGATSTASRSARCSAARRPCGWVPDQGLGTSIS
ncbi:hypothetical protein [Streptomyces sp. NPDC059072]|uniref:hypothetical protein n=1 Tax=Streptomyces sp. NPDC059072 TaxID=3346715 RepID=UPI0036A38463